MPKFMPGAPSLISELDGETMDEDELRSCAAAARGRLAELITDAKERERVDKRLGDALTLRSGRANIALRRALKSHEATRRFMQSQAAAVDEAGILGADRAVGLLGDPIANVIGTLFICPEGDYSEVRETLADGTPVCPKHRLVMTRTDD
jgi:hypothetical protein